MKSLICSLLLATASFTYISATDLVVSEGGGGGSYATILEALNAAASSGDRIIIVPKPGGASYIESLVITKSIQLISGTEGERWRLVGNITYNPTSAGSQLTIIAMENLSGTISTGIAAPAGARSNVRILGCKLNSGSITFPYNNFNLTCEADSIISGSITCNFGKIIGNYINSSTQALSTITIGNGDATGTDEYVYIVGNKLIGSNGNYYYQVINFTSNKYYFYISNNFIQTNPTYQYGIYVYSTKSGPLSSKVLNNTVASSIVNYYSPCYFYYLNSPLSVESNIIGSNFYYGIDSNSPLFIAVSFNHFDPYVTQILTGVVNDGTNTQSAFTFNPSNGVALTGSPVNGGNPDFGHYDLDLTANDAGTGGGSYAITQFLPMGSSMGSRTTFFVAPRRVLAGQTINISAEGFDK